jgi:hypothetical protein
MVLLNGMKNHGIKKVVKLKQEFIKLNLDKKNESNILGLRCNACIRTILRYGYYAYKSRM